MYFHLPPKMRSYLEGFVNFWKRQSLIEVIILILSIIGTWAVFWGPSVNIAKEDLALNKEEMLRQADPLIHYDYINDRFKAQSASDTEIKSVSWIIPDGFLKINQFSKDLIMDELRHSLILRLDGSQKTVNFVDCYIFGSEYYRGIPIIVETEYRQRGSNETYKLIDLGFIKGNKRDGFYLKVENNNTSLEETYSFQKDTEEEDYKIYRDAINGPYAMNECGIIFGYPEPGSFY